MPRFATTVVTVVLPVTNDHPVCSSADVAWSVPRKILEGFRRVGALVLIPYTFEEEFELKKMLGIFLFLYSFCGFLYNRNNVWHY